MELSRKQKMLLHTVPASLRLDDEQRRLIQRNIGGFESAADPRATREGFIAVMAFYEGKLGGQAGGFTPGYWAGENARANPTSALAHRLVSEAARFGWTIEQLDTFIAGPHMSSGACDDAAHAPAYWLRRCLEAVKAMATRKERTRNG